MTTQIDTTATPDHSGSAEPAPAQAACCAPAEQRTCCDAADKAECCGATAAKGTCGCR